MATSKANGTAASRRKTSKRKTARKPARKKAPAKAKATKPKAAVAPKRTPKPRSKASAEKTTAQPVGRRYSVSVDVDELRPLVAAAPTTDARFYLNGVHVCLRGRDLRITATDGHRLLVFSQPFEGELPWGKAGVIIPADALQRILRFTGKKWTAPLQIGYGENHKHVRITTAGAQFDVTPIDGQFPKLAPIMRDVGDVLASDRAPLETTAIAPRYLQGAGQIAKAVGASAVFCYPAADNRHIVFTFADAPGLIMVQMGLKTDKAALSGGAARLIGKSNLRGTLAALKAHRTRCQQAAESAKDDTQRAEHQARGENFDARIREIMEGLNPKLEHKPAEA